MGTLLTIIPGIENPIHENYLVAGGDGFWETDESYIAAELSSWKVEQEATVASHTTPNGWEYRVEVVKSESIFPGDPDADGVRFWVNTFLSVPENPPYFEGSDVPYALYSDLTYDRGVDLYLQAEISVLQTPARVLCNAYALNNNVTVRYGTRNVLISGYQAPTLTQTPDGRIHLLAQSRADATWRLFSSSDVARSFKLITTVWDENYRRGTIAAMRSGAFVSAAILNNTDEVYFRFSPDGTDWSQAPVKVGNLNVAGRGWVKNAVQILVTHEGSLIISTGAGNIFTSTDLGRTWK